MVRDHAVRARRHRPRYALRLGQLQVHHAVEIECVHCGRRGLVAPHRLHERFEPFERIASIAQVMKCRGCGRRGGIDWRSVAAKRQ
jgi:hypothetical protein